MDQGEGEAGREEPCAQTSHRGPPTAVSFLGMSKRHFKDLASPLSSHVCPLSPRGRSCIELSWGSMDLWAWRGGAISQSNGPISQTNTARRVLTSGTENNGSKKIQDALPRVWGVGLEHIQGLRPCLFFLQPPNSMANSSKPQCPHP